MNIKDIAKKAGVSVATISRVLNDKGVVAPSTRDKVLKIAEEEGYKTSLLGRNLRCRKTNIILVMTPSLSNRFCSKVVRGIEKIAEKEGYFIMVNAAGDSVTRQNLCFDLLRRNFADGMIVLSSVGVDKNLEELSKKHPVVQCSEYIYGIDVPYVSIDNYKAAYEETMHLINGGRKKIAYIGVNNALSSTLSLIHI